ncbi:glycosyl hydrolase, family 88 [Candidatus Koribacter versatilis Ellin345]|uniref:Glycosyl hydrolase, family 88 n=1 Tax=Koribacter versatilis (strain Ellin345) TaxID=204669 RepID=Q1IT35_KORVE|nr:glycoside hydrolase family 88 protein [Candidatus Koribacter versatilis]ABF39965.1 glycosyl hydrolase, family 88 [Candidatus Koribacter versatilis Ellin345]
MKRAIILAAVLLCMPVFAAQAQPAPSATEVLATMERVADWQLAHPSSHATTEWTQAAGYAGMMALANLSKGPRYREAVRSMGEANAWKAGPRTYHADDLAVGQTYEALYVFYKDPKIIAPLRERLDFILATPSKVQSLDFQQKYDQVSELWSWCDSLFMAPPVWVEMSAITGDPRYREFAIKDWWRTTDFLYDPAEHLYYRDSTYFNRREANGQKVFWSRGNGWVMAGLVRVLDALPPQDPSRPRFEKLYRDMAQAALKAQQPDGLWHASLLDPQSYPLKETSGSGFFTYALAWGVNHKLLDRAEYEPAVVRAWSALVACVDKDGKLTHVQPIGSDPKSFAEDSTEVYGVGAFLLAGSEVYRIAEKGKH